MGGDHGSHHSEPTREQIFAPTDFNFVEKYVFHPICALVDVPVTLFKTQIVDRIRVPQKMYHKRIERVPTIDECRVDDDACKFLAHYQFIRDKHVDNSILDILGYRAKKCRDWYDNEPNDVKKYCSKFIDDHREAQVNHFIKYGDIFGSKNVTEYYMKQKHRLIYERRYGEVGNGKSGLPKFVPPEKEKSMHDHMRGTLTHTRLPKEMQL